jgi:hypothetical protein
MENDINLLASFALNIDEVRNKFAPDVVAKFEEIVEYAHGLASDMFVQNP